MFHNRYCFHLSKRLFHRLGGLCLMAFHSFGRVSFFFAPWWLDLLNIVNKFLIRNMVYRFINSPIFCFLQITIRSIYNNFFWKNAAIVGSVLEYAKKWLLLFIHHLSSQAYTRDLL